MLLWTLTPAKTQQRCFMGLMSPGIAEQWEQAECSRGWDVGGI